MPVAPVKGDDDGMEIPVALREYVDSEGRTWMVWRVSPRFDPARSGDDRRLSVSGIPEDRRHAERRGVLPPPGWINGWLCFETFQEKRRLSPVPSEWESCSPEQLEKYRVKAPIIRSV